MNEVIPTPARTRRRALALASVVALGAGVAGWTLLAHGPAEASATPVSAPAAAQAALSVETVAPRRQDWARTVAATGSIAARDELLVGADATGVRLTEVLVDTGSLVKRGQLMARADDALLQTQLAQQLAQIRAAEADRAQALSNLERAERVGDSGLYSAEVLETRRNAAAAATARLELAQAQRRETEVKIAHTRVLAPADGVVTRRSATVGAVLQPGVELFRVMREQQLEWLAELPAHALADVKPGAAVRVSDSAGRAVDAQVRRVAPTIDPQTRNGLVHVALPPGTPLQAGGHARGEIAIGRATALTLPESVLLQRDGHPHVFLLRADGVAQLARIETGARQRGLVEVTGGLPDDARVISTGAGFVKDGERVLLAGSASSKGPAHADADAGTRAGSKAAAAEQPSQGNRS
jgi:RND family efflux transporter MFP subunit